MIGLDHFLSTHNTTHQLSALNFLEIVIQRLKDSDCLTEILQYCDVIETLSKHSSSSCREKALDIMKWIYDAFRPPFGGKDKALKEKLANRSRVCLIQGKSNTLPIIYSRRVPEFLESAFNSIVWSTGSTKYSNNVRPHNIKSWYHFSAYRIQVVAFVILKIVSMNKYCSF